MKIIFLIIGAACILFGIFILADDSFLGALFIMIGVVVGLLGFAPSEKPYEPPYGEDEQLQTEDEILFIYGED